MQIKAVKTEKIYAGDDFYAILAASLPKLAERSVVAITSKIVSLCQGNVVKNDGTVTKEQLVRQEADYYIENDPSIYGNIMLTRKNDFMVFSAGIDESNSNGDFVLWPHDIQKVTNTIWQYLREKNHIKELGVIITDSRLIPGHTGAVGFSLSWCGFSALNNFVGKKDVFGHEIRMTKVNLTEAFATAAVVVMGETNEQTPLAVISDIPFVQFQDRPPIQKELDAMHFPIAEDMYSKLLTSVTWQEGGHGKR